LRLIVLILVFPSILIAKNLTFLINDSFTKEPVSGVTVLVESSNLVSDSNGIATISIKEKESNVHVDFIKNGYQEKHIDLDIIIDTVSIKLIPLEYDFEDVTVYGDSSRNKGWAKISKSKLVNNLGNSLSKILSKMLGVSESQMGEAVTRPVINGLSGNRLQIINNNFKTKDLSSNSSDHSQAYNNVSLSSVSLVSGPDLVRYGSSLVGKSVVRKSNTNINNPIEENNSLLSVGYSTVNEKYNIATENEFSYPLGGLALNGQYVNAGNLITPQGTLDNTQYIEQNINLGTYYYIGEFTINPYADIFQKEYGLPGGFVGAHPNGVDIEMKRNAYGVNSEFHIHGRLLEKVKLNWERNFYDHKEFEASGLLGAQFRFVSNTVKLEVEQHQMDLFESGYIGLEYTRKDNQLGGFVFIPDNNYDVFSAYLNEKLAITDELDIKFGSRFELTKVNLERDYEFYDIIYRDFSYSALSSAIAINYQFDLTNSIRFELANSNRAPEPEELLSDGPHLAAYSYEVGNPELDLEKSISYSVDFTHLGDSWETRAVIFLYDYSNYITPVATGDTNFSTLLPLFRQINIPVQLYGFSFSANKSITENFKASANVSYTIGERKNNEGYLPFIPPFKADIILDYNLYNWHFSVNMQSALAQNNLGQFEEATDGYAILNASVKRNITIGEQLMSVIFRANNITNETYRNHLSRIKSVYPQPGFGAELIVNYFF
jgi:iron complex outermembrane receptor protein